LDKPLSLHLPTNCALLGTFGLHDIVEPGVYTVGQFDTEPPTTFHAMLYDVVSGVVTFPHSVLFGNSIPHTHWAISDGEGLLVENPFTDIHVTIVGRHAFIAIFANIELDETADAVDG
jgi:hypothetical protein